MQPPEFRFKRWTLGYRVIDARTGSTLGYAYKIQGRMWRVAPPGDGGRGVSRLLPGTFPRRLDAARALREEVGR